MRKNCSCCVIAVWENYHIDSYWREILFTFICLVSSIGACVPSRPQKILLLIHYRAIHFSRFFHLSIQKKPLILSWVCKYLANMQTKFDLCNGNRWPSSFFLLFAFACKQSKTHVSIESMKLLRTQLLILMSKNRPAHKCKCECKRDSNEYVPIHFGFLLY